MIRPGGYVNPTPRSPHIRKTKWPGVDRCGSRRTLATSTTHTRLVVSPDATLRLRAAADWLACHPADAELLVVGPTWEACDELVRGATLTVGARFGTIRLTLDRLAARLAAPALALRRLAPATGLSLAAITARAVHLLRRDGALSYFAPVAARPGFAAAVARTVDELRMSDVPADALRRVARGGADLEALAERIDRELADAGLADRAVVFAAAVDAVESETPPAGLPLLLLDVPVLRTREAALIAALARRAATVLATAPAGDARTVARLEAALACTATTMANDAKTSLAALQTHAFEDSAPPAAALDATVMLRSWPGEARECIEIAREIQAEAAGGVPFDRIAVFLRSTTEYRPHLEEAFRRADIPAFLARGTTRPDPAGRALLALLACAAEGLSARRFAEYVSLAQVPDPDATRDGGWAPPEHDLLPTAPAPEPAAPEDAASVRAPWRWERLLVDAAVIGGRERWTRRLDGLREQLRRIRATLDDADDELRAATLDRRMQDLEHLAGFALPLVGRLATLPRRAGWGEWLDHLRALAAAALRAPDGVLATLGELAPMAPVGPLELDEVQLVLAPRLRELTVTPPRRRYGAVFVAAAEAARGLAFDVVFVPGLAEKLFPRKIAEDPILLDAARATLDSAGLDTQTTRVEAERLALRLAIGAARTRVALSYPRVDVEQARPRVPSFYALEALRAGEGTLPGFDALAARAQAGGGRLGWPAPKEPHQAIDEAEYDLALLGPLRDAEPATSAGAAAYLLGANPHLARALRARARRWLRRWTVADGLVEPDTLARAALARHQLAARSYSPTALQHFAACPYRFFLQAVHRLAPREDPVALEVIDPLTRGAIFHDVQFAVLTKLRGDGLLPVRPATLGRALATLDDALAGVTAAWAEKVAPAIPRVWHDGVEGIGADLREWLRRAADADDGWTPHRFELAFGLPDGDREHADPASVRDPVPVIGALTLRGSIDLVERHGRGALRATDHKTGRARTKEGVVVAGGQALQPLLYALACERLLDEPVDAGRLYYCTADGGYQERVVPLDEHGRATAATVVDIVGRGLSDGFLPAAPAPRACEWCDYRPVCGPYEETRTARKPREKLADLVKLRSLP